MHRNFVLLALGAVMASAPNTGLQAGDFAPASHAINALGLDLLTKYTDARANALLSPYSIQTALAMTYAGADGNTRTEMTKALHYVKNEADLHSAFGTLQLAIEKVAKATAERAAKSRQWGGPSEPLTLAIANRLFGQRGYEFRQPFLDRVRETYRAPFQPVDYVRRAEAVRMEINAWVEEQTRRRIRDLVPPDGVNSDSRLVLVNAIYLKAPWEKEFSAKLTKPRPFFIHGGKATDVPTMMMQNRFGYARRDGFKVIAIPYAGRDVQLLVLLPDEKDGLTALEKKSTPQILSSNAAPGSADLILHLPKFKIEPPLLKLSSALTSLGMPSAFDKPPGSANFNRMAPRKPDDYLFVSEVFHKTFIELDEKGTEAAAATAAIMTRKSAIGGEEQEPIEVHVNRPFLFAIQHRPSGACLFLGRVTNPQVH